MSKRQQPSKRENRQRDLQARQFIAAHGPQRIQEQLGHLGFSDIAGLFAPDGSLLRNPHDIAPELRAAIKKLRIREFLNRDGEVVARHFDYQLEGKREPLRDLAQMAGLLQEAPQMQQGLQININMRLPDQPAPGEVLPPPPSTSAPSPPWSWPASDDAPAGDAPPESIVATTELEPTPPPPAPTAAPRDAAADRRERERQAVLDFEQADLARAIERLNQRRPKPPFAIM